MGPAAGAAASLPSLVGSAVAAGFSASPAVAPPDAELLGVSLDGAEASPAGSSEPADVEDSALLLVLAFVEDVVVEVEIVFAAAASALVFVGGVMSGVLEGTVSDTLVPPQALSARPHSSAAQAPSAPRRRLTTDPCAVRTWGSR